MLFILAPTLGAIASLLILAFVVFVGISLAARLL